MRNREISENMSTGKTHISYSADIDREIDGEESHEQGNFQVFICCVCYVADLASKSRATVVIFLIHFASGIFALMRDGLDSRGAARHRVSPNHPEFQQN